MPSPSGVGVCLCSYGCLVVPSVNKPYPRLFFQSNGCHPVKQDRHEPIHFRTMKKLLLSVTVARQTIYSVQAQIPLKYQGEADLGYSIGVGTFATGRVNRHTIQGVKIGSYFSTGIGLGIDYYHERQALFVPIYLDLKGYLPLSASVTPYFSLDIGAGSGATAGVSGLSGTAYTPAIGAKAGQFKAPIGYNVQRASESGSGLNMNAMQIKVGLLFRPASGPSMCGQAGGFFPATTERISAPHSVPLTIGLRISDRHPPKQPGQPTWPRPLGFSVAVFLLHIPLRRRLSPVFRPTLRPLAIGLRISDRHPPKQPGQPTWTRPLFSAFLLRRRFRSLGTSPGTHLRTPLPGLSAPGGRSLHSNPPLPPRCTARPSANTNKPSGAQPPPRRILRFVPFISHNVLAINFVPAKFVGGGILLPLSHRKA